MASTHDPTTSATASIAPDLFRYSSVVIYITFCHTVMCVTRPDFARPCCKFTDVRLPEPCWTINIWNVPPLDSEHSIWNVSPLNSQCSHCWTLGHSDTWTLRHLDTWMLRCSDTWTCGHVECSLSEAAVPVQS